MASEVITLQGVRLLLKIYKLILILSTALFQINNLTRETKTATIIINSQSKLKHLMMYQSSIKKAHRSSLASFWLANAIELKLNQIDESSFNLLSAYQSLSSILSYNNCNLYTYAIFIKYAKTKSKLKYSFLNHSKLIPWIRENSTIEQNIAFNGYKQSAFFWLLKKCSLIPLQYWPSAAINLLKLSYIKSKNHNWCWHSS